MVNWKPEGGVGELFQIMKPFQPPPPEGVKSPFEWGKRDRVQELLGDAYDLNIEEHVSMMRSPSGEDYWQLFVTSYGPTKTLAESLDDDRREELHRSWAEFFDANYSTGDGIEHPRPCASVVRWNAALVRKERGSSRRPRAADVDRGQDFGPSLDLPPARLGHRTDRGFERMRWLRGCVRTNMTISATSSAVIIPARASASVPGLPRARTRWRRRPGTTSRAADALLAQLVIERAREADLPELRGAVDGLVRSPRAAPPRRRG
jgi:hypothetical protein